MIYINSPIKLVKAAAGGKVTEFILQLLCLKTKNVNKNIVPFSKKAISSFLLFPPSNLS